MTNRKFRAGFLLLAGLLIVANITAIVSSAGIVGVSPGNIYFKNVLRGGYAEKYLTITINSEEPVDVQLIARGDIKDWLEFQENISVSKNNPKRVKISIKPPSDIPNGNYTGFIRVVTDPLGTEIKEKHATSTVRAVIDVSLSVEVTDIEVIRCSARNFKVNSVEEKDDITFSVNILNEGNVRLKPKIIFEIWDQEQISVVKTVELKGKEILPTREEKLSFNIESHDLDLGQYWVNVEVIECLASETLTFDVLEPGTLKAEGVLLDILSKVWAEVGETIPILVNFKNTGEKEIEAQFRGKITRNGKIIQILESEKTLVPVSETTNFSFYFTPRKEGKYIISGRVFYDKKRTFELSAIVNVVKRKISIREVITSIAYALLIIFIVFLIYKIREEKRRYKKEG